MCGPKIYRASKPEVAIGRFHIHGAVRRVVHRINETQRTGGVRQPRNLRNRIDGADGVRRVADRHQLRLRAELALQVVKIEVQSDSRMPTVRITTPFSSRASTENNLRRDRAP